MFQTWTNFVGVVKWSGLFYGGIDNGPHARTPKTIQIKAPHALQIVMNLAYEDADCFRLQQPMIVPAKTFLSQLL